jgi:hypothetical protein
MDVSLSSAPAIRTADLYQISGQMTARMRALSVLYAVRSELKLKPPLIRRSGKTGIRARPPIIGERVPQR